MPKAILVHGVDITDATLQFGRDEQSIRDVEVVLTSQITRVGGSVTLPRDIVPSEVTILAFATRRELWYERSRGVRRTSPKRDGSFSIDGLPPDDYFVAALETPADPGELQDPDVLDRLSRSAKRVRLGEGQTASVALRLTR